MMDKETLYHFFEGIASLSEEEAVRRWLESSPDNRRELLKERKMFDSILLLGGKNSISKERKNNHIARSSSLRTELLKIAGIILLTLGGTHLYRHYTANEDQSMQIISVPAGQRVNITLPDGTNVWLNARTTIQYPLTFNQKKRQVKLDGQAYFDVVKNPERPFVVQTEKFDVEVLGTKFDVEAYSDKGEFETTLMQGSVKLTSTTNQSQTLTLKPDSKALLVDGQLQVVAVDNYNSYRWKEGLICFNNESFSAIMRDFEKYYGISIEVGNSSVLKYFYTGKFRQADGIDYALRVLQQDIQFTYTRDDENRIIYIK